MGKTEVVFILDRSGSMSGLEKDTIGGYNSMLKKQQKVEGEAVVTTVLFNHNYRIVHNRVDIKKVKPITEKEYFVEGYTALLDAVGLTINKVKDVMRNIKKEHQADKVVFIIITDGMENSSREYSYEKVRAMIEKQKEEHNWEFIFLGANIDATSTAARFGISKDRAADYHADSEGIGLNYSVVGDLISRVRTSNDIDDDWKERIDRDFKKRGN